MIRPPSVDDRRRRRRRRRAVAPASARRSRRPRSSAARASPAASLPGWTSAVACFSHTAPRIGRAMRRMPAPRPRSDARRRRRRGPRHPSPTRRATRAGAARSRRASAPTRSQSASMPYAAMSSPMASRFAMPSRSSSSISSGQRLRPLSRPWVRLASQKPPLRPEAAQPDRARLDDDDAGVGVAALGEQRGPQPGVAAADDHEVGGRGSASARGRAGCCGQVVEPEDALARARRDC